MSKPIFFISSTISDLKDLRSAIKFFLEEQGCQVMASEFNDFEKDLDYNNFEACIASLKKAQYYILIIGDRVGSYYNEKEGISITRQEYREAYKLHLENKLKLILFVRSEILTLWNNDKTFPQQDSPYQKVFEFINEVTGCDSSANSTARWLHAVTSFRDVVDVLNSLSFVKSPIEKVYLERLLLIEMKEMMRISLYKLSEGEFINPKRVIDRFYKKNEISTPQYNSTYNINAKDWDALCVSSFELLRINRYNCLLIEHALTSHVFLKFDHKSEAFQEEPIYDLLLKLHKEVSKFNSLNNPETTSVVFKYAPPYRDASEKILQLDQEEVLKLLALLRSWSNILDLLKASISLIQDNRLIEMTLYSHSPVPGKSDEIEKETATKEDVEMYLKLF